MSRLERMARLQDSDKDEDSAERIELEELAPSTVMNEGDTIDEIIIEYQIEEAENHEDVGKEVESDPQPEMSTTTVQEVILNADLQKQPTKAGVNGNVNLVRLNGDASKLNGTDKKSKISTTIEDCKSKAKEFLSNVPEVTPAVKDTALKTLYVVIASFVLFFLIVAYRVGRSFYTVEDTYVCNILGYVDGMAHSTLAPELCTRYHDDLYTEFGNEGARLAGEIHDGVGNVFTNIADGMKVMYDVSSTVSAHYYNLIGSGFAELFENMSENLSYLFTFMYDCVAFVEYYFLFVIDRIADFPQSIYHRIKSLYIEEESSAW